MSQLTAAKSQAPAPAPTRAGGLLQRKCACGTHTIAGGECDGCSRKQAGVLRRSTVNSGRVAGVPPVVGEVLDSPGSPLDAGTRQLMETRFNHDFSRVRVHTDARAAESAAAVGALAYTVGKDVVFGSNQFSQNTPAGRRLLAHELTHVIQQENAPAGAASGELEVGPADDSLERQADRAAASAELHAPVGVGAHGRRLLQRAPVGAGGQHGSPLPYREATELADCVRILGQGSADYCRQEVLGEGPPAPAPPAPATGAACFAPLCAQVSRAPRPATDAAAQSRSNEWLNGALNCMRSSAAGSNVSHAREIVANEEAEINADAARLNRELTGGRRGAGRFRTFLNGLQQMCQRKAREIEVELRYNVIFENQPGQPQWGVGDASWDSIESALAALPAEATTNNPRLIRFRRSACHPRDLTSTGYCFGRIGGETDPATSVITLFDTGLGSTPYSRSRSLGLSATFQTVRHEVAHVVDTLVPLADRNDFFENIVHWHVYPWAWVQVNPAPFPTYQAERNRLSAEMGLNDADLNAFLAGLRPEVPVVRGPRTYRRDDTGNFLNSYETARVPSGVEFEYARTNQGDYFAEIYTMAVSRPEFLYDSLPREQSAWLKRVVFRTPADLRALALQAALVEPARTEFIVRGVKLFTRDQLDALLNEILTRTRHGGGAQTA